jgi:NAD(P)-dependent dehydrogenase (short-subunit alcohol dehydrogenase family)
MARAFITGANRGLGFETAKELASRGWDVVLAGRDLEATRKAAGAIGTQARAVAVRVTEAFRARLTPSANIVMVSSGMGELRSFSPELRRRLLDPLLTFEVLDELARDFVERVRSGRDLGGFPRNAYSVSKAALNAFVRLLSRELPSGQRVNAVCPGWVRTRMGGAGASRTVEKGASGIVWAATLEDGGPNGGFFRDARPIDW